jgi:hypothetical protein
METTITLLLLIIYFLPQIIVVAVTSLTTALIIMVLRTILIIIIAIVITIHPAATIYSKTITALMGTTPIALMGTPIIVAPIIFFQTTITITVRQIILSIETIARTHPIIFSVTIIQTIIMGHITLDHHQLTFLTIAITITIILLLLVTISSIKTTIQVQGIFSTAIILEITTQAILL